MYVYFVFSLSFPLILIYRDKIGMVESAFLISWMLWVEATAQTLDKSPSNEGPEDPSSYVG